MIGRLNLKSLYCIYRERTYLQLLIILNTPPTHD